MTRLDYSHYEAARQNVIRSNASRRMRRMEQLPVPPKIERPKAVQLFDKHGDYIGTWAVGISAEDAMDSAENHGYEHPFTFKMV